MSGRFKFMSIALLVVLLLASQIAGCGNGNPATPAKPNPATSPNPSKPAASSTSSSAPATSSATKATTSTAAAPLVYSRTLAETRVEYLSKGAWVATPPPPLGPADNYEIKIGSARYTNNLDTPGSIVHGITMYATWSAPPPSFAEGDSISITAKGWGTIDVKRQVNPTVWHASITIDAGQYKHTEQLVDPQADNKNLVGLNPTITWKTPVNDPTEYDIVETVYVGSYGINITYVYVRSAAASAPELEPLVFIPGITGSQLMALNGDILWPPLGPGAERGFSERDAIRKDFVRLSLNPATAPHEALIASDVIRTDGTDMYYGALLDFLVKSGGYREYRVNNDPRRRTAANFDMTQKDAKPTLFVFAYDWRLSNVDNAKALADYVNGIQRMYPGKKVNIIAHSMGGLIARRFIIDNPGKVNKLITIATPFLGSVKPVYQMIEGTTGTGFFDFVNSALFGDELKDMLRYYPSVHEILPSESYYKLGGDPAYTYWPIGEKEEPLYYAQLVKGPGPQDKWASSALYTTLFGPYGSNGKTPEQDNIDFHSYTNNGNNQDDWSKDTTGVRYYHIVGVQKADKTIKVLRELRTIINSADTAVMQIPAEQQGDGTVPRLSAERKAADGRNLNAPGATVLALLGTGNNDDLLEHAGLVKNPEVLSKLLEFLKAK